MDPVAALMAGFAGALSLENLYFAFIGCLFGTLVGVLLMALGRGGRRTALPFGTFLAPVAVAVYVWGPDLIRWYAGFLRPR